MANVFFNRKFEVCTKEDFPAYLYVDDVEAFLRECGDEWIFDNVDKKGVYHWNDCDMLWEPAIFVVEEKIRGIIEQGLSLQGGNISIGWNIIITLDSGEVIKTNSEPVEMNEVQKAINAMLKPSFFGKRIKKFEIVAE